MAAAAAARISTNVDPRLVLPSEDSQYRVILRDNFAAFESYGAHAALAQWIVNGHRLTGCWSAVDERTKQRVHHVPIRRTTRGITETLFVMEICRTQHTEAAKSSVNQAAMNGMLDAVLRDSIIHEVGTNGGSYLIQGQNSQLIQACKALQPTVRAA